MYISAKPTNSRTKWPGVPGGSSAPDAGFFLAREQAPCYNRPYITRDRGGSMTRGRHSDDNLRRRAEPGKRPTHPTTRDTSPGQPLRISLKGSAPQVYQRRRVQPTETLPMWVWMLFLLLATLFYFLSQA